MDRTGVPGGMTALATTVLAAALTVSATVAGVMLGAAISAEPVLGTLPPDGYVRAKRFLVARMDPLMPIGVGCCGVLDLVSALLVDGTARVGAIAALVLTVALIGVSQIANVPINRSVLRLDPDDLPADWTDPRRRWDRWHRARTATALLATLADLGALIAAAR